MKKMINTIYVWFPHRLWDKIVVAFISVLGYFSPIKGMTHLMIGLFVVDILFGWWKDKKLNGAKFQPSIVWEKTAPRMAIVVILLVGSYMLDEKTGQGFVSTTRIICWVFGALLLHSIAINGYYITGWKALALLGKFTQRKIEKDTGIKITEEDIN